EEILIGDLRLIYNPETEQAETTSSRPLKTTTIRVEAVQASYRVDLEPPTDPVTPGAHVQATLLIENISKETDRYSIEVEGIPSEWVRIERAALEIDPGTQVSISITFKPLRRSSTRPGDYVVTVRVRSLSVEQPVEAVMPLTVRTYSGFGMVLATPRVTREIPFELRVHNQGSGPLPITLSGTAPNNDLLIQPSLPTVTLAPGENRIIQGYVRSRRDRLIGPTRERRYDLLVRSQDASGFLAAVQGTFIERSWLPTWVLGVIGVVGVLLITACVALSMFLLRPRSAEIASFVVEPSTVYRNLTQQIGVSWRVINARRIRLQTDGIRLDVPLPDDVSSVNSVQLVGKVANTATITLLVEGEDGEAVLDPRTLVTMPPTCTALRVEPGRRGPSTSYTPEGQLTVAQVYPIDRRNADTTWLRIEVANLWIPLDALDCSAFAPTDLTLIGTEEIPPTPTATATPTVTATATPTATATNTPTPTLTPTIAPPASATPQFPAAVTVSPGALFSPVPTTPTVPG
ncbi:MAG: hypothetical protein KF726_22280, partial [Anaerolineae bacterium]|nr:hypothetical protein [Anaerolineae bacterium]